jgi:XTP/dITP diphosphohydrolase
VYFVFKKMNKLLIATNNKGKSEELRDLLNGMNIELVTPTQINLELDVVEDGLTYAENAAKKAVAFAKASNLISLADDSGLEVDALDGAPGLYSARYGSPNGDKLSDGERCKYLLQNLRDKPRTWTARFKATIAIAIPSSRVTLSRSAPKGLGENQAETLRSPASTSDFVLRSARGSLRVAHVEGICEGEIIPEERGTGGFGYDPIFLLHGLRKTMAELSMDEKNRLSHRAKAVIKARELLKKLFAN